MTIQLKSLPRNCGYRLKKFPTVEMRKIGKKFTGKFVDIPLILEAEGRNPDAVLKGLGRGLVLQYQLVMNQDTDFHKRISAGMADFLEAMSTRWRRKKKKQNPASSFLCGMQGSNLRPSLCKSAARTN